MVFSKVGPNQSIEINDVLDDADKGEKGPTPFKNSAFLLRSLSIGTSTVAASLSTAFSGESPWADITCL